LGLGVVVGAILGLRVLPGWLLGLEVAPGWERLRAVGAQAALVVGLVLEVGLWTLATLLLLLGPLLVVERCGVWSGLRQWLALLRRQLGRALLYEALAAGVGALAGLPLFLPLLALAATYQPDPSLLPTAQITQGVLGGLALTLLLAYLIVANVFIYLNLRYPSGGRR
jgi:hypothetical protein